VDRMTGRTAPPLPTEGRFPSLAGATAWLNSPPLDPAGLRGKVVVVEFCTYTCINWLRTLPYVRAWAEKYRDNGVVVIGVHTPEFSFEHELENVRRALEEMNVGYPIAVDSDHAIWEAFANRYWPALYFIDPRGNIRHHRFGEGDYEGSETVIQQLLTEAGVNGIVDDLVAVDPFGPESEADWDNLHSPETYLGVQRAGSFASPGGMRPSRQHSYIAPARLALNEWALSGDWTAESDKVLLNGATGRICLRFHARVLHLVMGPMGGTTSVAFRVTIDGEPPRASSGGDVDVDGGGLLDEPRMYQLIRRQGPVVDSSFEIEFLDAGAGAYVFTFG
jgi:thiol-disulfide isomerase/thioredoxin